MFNFVPELRELCLMDQGVVLILLHQAKIALTADKRGFEIPTPDVARSKLRSRRNSSEIADVEMASPRAQSPDRDVSPPRYYFLFAH
jgi:hypothetical protein